MDNDPANPANLARLSMIVSPACDVCGAGMRLVSIEPHERYTNLDSREFVCDCGANISDTVARIS
jgi:hypothetical protein